MLKESSGNFDGEESEALALIASTIPIICSGILSISALHTDMTPQVDHAPAAPHAHAAGSVLLKYVKRQAQGLRRP